MELKTLHSLASTGHFPYLQELLMGPMLSPPTSAPSSPALSRTNTGEVALLHPTHTAA